MALGNHYENLNAETPPPSKSVREKAPFLQLLEKGGAQKGENLKKTLRLKGRQTQNRRFSTKNNILDAKKGTKKRDKNDQKNPEK